jgi:hypothetical protein
MTAPHPQPSRAGGLRFLRVIVLLMCFGIALNSAGVYVTWRLNHKSVVSLCELRSDLERRVASSKQFLRDNPHGIPGIPAKQIRDSINNQSRTIRSLNSLSCP